MKKIIIFINVLFAFGCSFKKDEANSSGGTPENKTITINENDLLDDDGDLISNGEERKRGLNPKVANIPSMDINFAKDYIIKINYKNKSDDFIKSFVIDTRNEKEVNGVEVKTGKHFLYDFSKAISARNFKVSNYSSANMPIAYFRRFTSSKLPFDIIKKQELEFYSEFDPEVDEIESIEVEIFNLANLKSSYLPAGISELELSYLLFDDTTDEYREVSRGIVTSEIGYDSTTSFNVKLDNIPIEMFLKSYFSRGEFLTTQVENYKFNDKDLYYKDLISSVEKKSIPVAFFYPGKSDLKYISVMDGLNHFSEIIAKGFSKNLIFSGDVLVGVNESLSGLDEIDSLSDLAGEYTNGQWFVQTNLLDSHYTEHQYKPSDSIIMSYYLGDELSKSVKENVLIGRELQSTEKERLFLGNFTKNSYLEISIVPRNVYGERFRTDEITFNRCRAKINQPYSFSERMVFTDELNLYGEKIKLTNGSKSISLKELADQGLISLRRIGNTIVFETKELTEIFHIDSIFSSPLYLKAEPIVTNDLKGYGITEVSQYSVDDCVSEIRTYDDDLPFYLTPHQVEQYKKWSNSDDIYGNVTYDYYDYAQHFNFLVSGNLKQYY